MAREPNTDSHGNSFSSAIIEAVWKKGREIQGYDPAVWRRDMCGKNIKFAEHGNADSGNGWEIDHIKPVAKGGSDDLSNLQPLQWENNRSKGDTHPWSLR